MTLSHNSIPENYVPGQGDFCVKEHKWPSKVCVKTQELGFPGGAVVESLPANAGDTGSSPGLGGSHMPRSD